MGERAPGSRFRVFWFGQAVSQLGSAVTIVALPLVAVKTIDANALAVSVMMALQWTPSFLLGIPIGAWVDRRVQKRRVLQSANVVSAVSLLSVPVAYGFGMLSLVQLYVVALLLGLASTVFSVALAPFLRGLVGRGGLASANAKLQLTGSVARVAGPGIGGVLLILVTPPSAIWIDAASFLVSLICLNFVGMSSVVRDVARPTALGLRAMVSQGIAFVGQSRTLRVLTGTAAMANLTMSGIGAIEIVYLTRNLGVSSAGVGIIVAIGAVGGVVGAGVSAKLMDRFGSYTASWAPLAVTAPLALLLVVPGHWVAVGLFPVGLWTLEFAITVSTVAGLTLRMEAAPPEMLGRVSGLMRMISLGSIPLGSLLAGALSFIAGTYWAMVILIVLNAVPIIWYLRARPAVLREQRLAEDEQDGDESQSA